MSETTCQVFECESDATHKIQCWTGRTGIHSIDLCEEHFTPVNELIEVAVKNMGGE